MSSTPSFYSSDTTTNSDSEYSDTAYMVSPTLKLFYYQSEGINYFIKISKSYDQ